MTEPLTETALIDNALAAIGVVLARMNGDPGSAVAAAAGTVHRESSRHIRIQEATPERVAIHCCLISASALLDVSQTLIDRAAQPTPTDQVQYWNTLVERTKVAGRAAYRASLALADPDSRYR